MTIQEKSVEYSRDGATFEGYLAWNDTAATPCPVVVVSHAWGGLGDFEQSRDALTITIRDGEAVPVPVRTGVTDLEYSEIVSGLEPTDEVLLLPSSSLFEQQEMLQNFISERFSSTPFQQQGGGGGGGGGRFR